MKESRPAAVAILLLSLAAAVAIALYAGRYHRHQRTRVASASVSGRAAAALDDSGMFRSPVLPRDAHPFIPHADAESAAVAMGYWEAPSVLDRTVRYYHEIPTERRHFCGRTYYVRAVVGMPDTTVVQTRSGNDWTMWAPTWVMPICDDKGDVRSSVEFTDLPTGLHVIQGPAAHDVPELVPDSGTWPHIGEWPSKVIRDWEYGIGVTPETAVAVAEKALGNTGSRIAEVPEAFATVMLLPPQPPAIRSSRIFGNTANCPRWRLTLDRPVTLRGVTSGRVVHTDTLYVTRGEAGCHGAGVLQIPRPTQPAMIPFMYLVSRPIVPGTRITHPPAPDMRWTTLRVTEPLWFEEARPTP